MTAVYYEGGGRFSVGTAQPQAPGEGEVRIDVAYCGVCGTDLHIAHGAMDQRVRPPQVIGHEMSGVIAEIGAGVDGFRRGDPVVVRPLDARAETPADKGYSHVSRGLKFLGIDTPGAFSTRGRFPPSRSITCRPPSICGLLLWSSRSRWPVTTCVGPSFMPERAHS